MNATVTCEKCGKPLGVFDGNTCADCSKIDAIRAEIASHIGGCGFLNDGLDLALEIIDKHMGDTQ